MPTLIIRTFITLENQTGAELLGGIPFNVVHGHSIAKHFETQEEVDEIVTAIKKFRNAPQSNTLTNIGGVVDLETYVK